MHAKVRVSICFILAGFLVSVSIFCVSPKMVAAQSMVAAMDTRSAAVVAADKAIDQTALEILCKTNGNFAALQTYMESQGWVHEGATDITSDMLVPSNLDLTMDRYYYQSTPVRVKAFIHFLWHDVLVLDGGDNDTVGIAFNGSRLQPVDSALSAYHQGQDISSSGMMWLSNTNANGYTWGLWEPQFGINYVDQGAASVTLLGRDTSSITDNFYGTYIHVFNTTHVTLGIGYPSGITVTWSSGPDCWTKAITSYQ